jgi:hypothetical protein
VHSSAEARESQGENVSCAPTPSRAPVLPKKHKNMHEKNNRKYEWIDDVKMHAHAKIEVEKSFVLEEKKRQINLSIGVSCGFT